MKTDVSRSKAQYILDFVLEPYNIKVLARKKTKTKPGLRKELAIRRGNRYRVVARGKTWVEASLALFNYLKLDVLKTNLLLAVDAVAAKNDEKIRGSSPEGSVVL